VRARKAKGGKSIHRASTQVIPNALSSTLQPSFYPFQPTFQYQQPVLSQQYYSAFPQFSGVSGFFPQPFNYSFQPLPYAPAQLPPNSGESYSPLVDLQYKYQPIQFDSK
jgi:hypothetical protein